MEVRVHGVDFLDSMLAHEHGGVDIVQDVTAQMRHVGDDFREDRRMASRGQKKARSRGIEQRLQKAPGRCDRHGIA